MDKKPVQIKTASYKVENEITLLVGKSNYKTSSSYSILLKKSNSSTFDFIVDRGQITINGNVPDTKFLSISDHYFNCLFPIHFLLTNGSLIVANFSEINDRIIQKDKELKSNFSGDGIDYISTSFLAKTNSEEKLQDFISSLNLVNAILLSLQKFKRKENINWYILPICNTSWQGISDFDATDNSFVYNAKMEMDSEFINELRPFATDNYSEFDFTNSFEFSSEIRHKTEYLDESLKFRIASTHIHLKFHDFEYNEAFIIKSKTAN